MEFYRTPEIRNDRVRRRQRDRLLREFQEQDEHLFATLDVELFMDGGQNLWIHSEVLPDAEKVFPGIGGRAWDPIQGYKLSVCAPRPVVLAVMRYLYQDQVEIAGAQAYDMKFLEELQTVCAALHVNDLGQFVNNRYLRLLYEDREQDQNYDKTLEELEKSFVPDDFTFRFLENLRLDSSLRN